MLLTDFHYELPEHLIAQYPLEHRTDSRLMCLNAATGSVEHHVFHEIIEYLQPDDVLIFNNQRVLHGRTAFDRGECGRHLRTCHEDLDEFHSRLRVLSRRQGRDGADMTLPVGAMA